jgi:hypothetical protein
MAQDPTQSAARDPRYRSLYIIGGIGAFVQLIAILVMIIAVFAFGPKPATAEEFFTIQQGSAFEVILRSDFILIFLIGPYLFTFSALYFALKDINPVVVGLAVLFTLIVVVVAFAKESTLSLLYLGELYSAAGSDALRVQYLAAGEAVIASDLWNSTSGYIGGILLQGGGVMISIVMLRSKDFRKVTAIAGLLGNGLDLFQHIIYPFAPGLGEVIKSFMGVFYLVWFPMLGLDLFRLATQSKVAPVGQEGS